jgi:hypothetical protein
VWSSKPNINDFVELEWYVMVPLDMHDFLGPSYKDPSLLSTASKLHYLRRPGSRAKTRGKSGLALNLRAISPSLSPYDFCMDS